MEKIKESLNLNLKINSDQKVKNTLKININDDDWLLDLEPYAAFTDSVCIEFYEKSKKIGELTGIYFKISQIVNKDSSIFDVFDSLSQETYLVYDALIDKDGDFNFDYCGMKSNIFYIDRFYIEEEYRNLGLGKKILRQLDDILIYSLNYEVGCYILEPCPIEKDTKYQYCGIEDEKMRKKLKSKLIKFYKKCGYNKIPKSDFMYVNTDYIIDYDF